MIVFDENIEQYWIDLTKNLGIPYVAIRDHKFGIADDEVLRIAINENALLVTEDKDFGQLVFSHGYRSISVLLFRYDNPKNVQIEKTFMRIISDYDSSNKPSFMVLTDKKLRIRYL